MVNVRLRNMLNLLRCWTRPLCQTRRETLLCKKRWSKKVQLLNSRAMKNHMSYHEAPLFFYRIAVFSVALQDRFLAPFTV